MERKKFLKQSLGLIGITTIAIDACKKDVAGTTSDTGTGTSTSTDTCYESPTETEGPYPYPEGEINNPLNRSDITGGQTGVPLTLTLTIVDANNSCSAVENARVDIWHCSKDGDYSGYGNFVGQTFLRGYVLANANGEATFTTIYPGWYSGRATHIHAEIYVNNVMKKTTQIAFPDSINNTVHTSSLYSLGVNPITNSKDGILGNSSTDLAHETVTISGSVSDGYTAGITIGLTL